MVKILILYMPKHLHVSYDTVEFCLLLYYPRFQQ